MKGRASSLWALVGLVATLRPGCGAPRVAKDHAVDASVKEDASTPNEATLTAITVAEDERHAAGVRPEWRTSSDVVVRRRATRALARIAEPTTEADLLRALGDEDREVVGWGAYGLGWTCKGKEDERVKALAARAATLAEEPAATHPGRETIDAPGAIARSIGRCGGTLAEGVLAGLFRSGEGDDPLEEAAYALGAIAGRHALSDETIGLLLDRATAEAAKPIGAAALYPIGRLDRVPPAWTRRVLEAARAIRSQPNPLGAFVVRALEKAGPDAVSDLESIALTPDVDAAERADAARALGRLGVPGHDGAATALTRLLRDHAWLEPTALGGDTFNVLLALVEAIGTEPPKNADPTLYTLSALPVPAAEAPKGLTRRVVALRCAAAAVLARGAYDAEIVAKCDPDPGGALGQRARLLTLLRRPLVGERRKAFRALATSSVVTVREAVLEAIATHPELEEAGRLLLVQALAAPEPGVVATAAQTIVQHPEHVLTLAFAERRAALDPRAPPPTTHPALDLPADLAQALTQAILRPWKEDAVETRTSLLDAAVAVRLPLAKDTATHACTDANATLREHAVRALRALGNPEATCPVPANPDAKASEATLTHAVTVTFTVGDRKLGVAFEPALTPVAASRFVALARSGFYKGIVVHRVVPGYVVQFGDPGGDGYGGSGHLLRCETSPVPFDALDVGVALAGRDTGSSQVFVTLARYPKLDGDYARVGRATGDWSAVAEGDVIEGVVVEE